MQYLRFSTETKACSYIEELAAKLDMHARRVIQSSPRMRGRLRGLFNYLIEVKFSVYFQQRFPLICRFLNPRKDDLLLDAGCGFGAFTSELAEKRMTAVGVDILPKAIRKAHDTWRVKRNTSFLVSSIEHLPFRSRIFDNVICIDTIEYLAEPVEALKEINRVMKDDTHSTLTLTTPHKFRIHPLLKERRRHVTEYTLESLTDLLSETKFKVIDTADFYRTFATIASLTQQFLKKLTGMIPLLYHFFSPFVFFASKLDVVSKSAGGGILVSATKLRK